MSRWILWSHDDNVDALLKEYGSEVDVAFVRKKRYVNVLLDLVGMRVRYVVQEVAVVMKVCKICSTHFMCQSR
ncbi:adapter-related protein complex 1 beta subunit [Pisolithus marmoratus]|nr:adapter-related protein complex 1 beta subunit [Pisolithus marmoratus]